MQGNAIFLARKLGKFEDACTKNTRKLFIFESLQRVDFSV